MGVTAPVALFVLAGLLHVLAALLDRSGRIRLHHWAEEAGPTLRALYEGRRRFQAFRALLVTGSGAALLGGVLLAVPLLNAGPALLGGVGVLLLAELLARVAVGRWAEETLSASTPAYRALQLVLAPLLLLARERRRTPSPPVDEEEEEGEEASEDEIQAFLQVGAVEGILEPGEEDLVARIIDFGDTVVKSVMTPRIDMICLPADSDVAPAADLFLSSKHSRIPLYSESIDSVVGILHIRDVLGAVRSDGDADLVSLAGDPFFVPETKAVSVLLGELQARRQQMAIVVDEFGGTAGLVTLEDLLEEIVGEVAVEHEPPPDDPVPIEDGVWRIQGGSDLEVLEELFGVELEEEPYETIGGMVFGLVGDVPRVGQSVERRGLLLTVEEVTDRRVRQVRVERSGAGAAETAAEEGA